MPGHAERPDRLRAIHRHLSATGLLAELDVREARPVEDAMLTAVHDPRYLHALATLSPESGLVVLDPDTAMCPATLRAAHMATGAVVDAVGAVLAGAAETAFCAVRPPGHHAEHDAAMGFCIYNSLAVAAAAALANPGIDRVAVLDFDVHHGNGTVEIFQDRPEVLVCSAFQHPFYPHRYHDVQRPNIVNTPLPAGTGSRAWRAAIERDWLPALEAHRPDLILVSAGFDAHRDDPLGGLELNEADFTWVTLLISDAARRFAGGRVVSALEGGYDLDALSRSVHAHIDALSV
ncbi:MAG TPA: histone deacetylase family protein [Pseudomonadales bacterium]